MKLFIFGLGYSATYIAQRLAAGGVTITATVRSQAKADLLSGSGYTMRLFATADRDETIARELADSDAVLVSVPPATGPRASGLSRRSGGDGALALDRLSVDGRGLRRSSRRVGR